MFSYNIYIRKVRKAQGDTTELLQLLTVSEQT